MDWQQKVSYLGQNTAQGKSIGSREGETRVRGTRIRLRCIFEEEQENVRPVRVFLLP